MPEKITIDGSEANAAAIRSYNQEPGITTVIRQVKYVNNIVEQDHRAVKRVTRPMLGFKSSQAAPSTRAGIELMHMLGKGQLAEGIEEGLQCGRTVLLPGCLIPLLTGATHPRATTHKICDGTRVWQVVLGRGSMSRMTYHGGISAPFSGDRAAQWFHTTASGGIVHPGIAFTPIA